MVIKENKKQLGVLYSALYIPEIVTSTKSITPSLAQRIPTLKSNKAAGFTSVFKLQESISLNVSPELCRISNISTINDSFDRHIDEIESIVASTLISAKSHLQSKVTRIYLFPTFSDFIQKEMRGISGFSPYEYCNTIHIFIHPTFPKGWQNSLKETIAHEFFHSVHLEQDHHFTRLDNWIIFEGLAEYFTSQILDRKTLLVKSILSDSEVLSWLPQVNKIHKSKNFNVNLDIIYGSKKYPQWLGYKIGYVLVKSFLNHRRTITWIELMKMDPSLIYKEAL